MGEIANTPEQVELLRQHNLAYATMLAAVLHRFKDDRVALITVFREPDYMARIARRMVKLRPDSLSFTGPIGETTDFINVAVVDAIIEDIEAIIEAIIDN